MSLLSHAPPHPEMIIQQFLLYHMAVFIVWKGAMYQLTFSGLVYTVHKTRVLKRQLVLINWQLWNWLCLSLPWPHT